MHLGQKNGIHPVQQEGGVITALCSYIPLSRCLCMSIKTQKSGIEEELC